MCGIIGITGSKPVSSSILSSLRKLEYRGYDSAGIATLEKGLTSEIKCEGRVDTLEKNISIFTVFKNLWDNEQFCSFSCSSFYFYGHHS